MGTVLFFAACFLAGAFFTHHYYRTYFPKSRSLENVLGVFTVEQTLASFESQMQQRQTGGISIHISWSKQEADIEGKQGNRNYELLLQVEGANIPSFISLIPSQVSSGSQPVVGCLEQRQQRDVVKAVQRSGIQVTSGVVVLQVSINSREPAQELLVRLTEKGDLALKVAQHLDQLGPMLDLKLVKLVAQGSLQQQQSALVFLCEHFPTQETTTHACRSALGSDQPALQVIAAMFLGDAALVDLAAAVDPREVPVDLWISALTRLSRLLPWHQLVRLLELSLAMESRRLLTMVVDCYRNNQSPPPVGILAEMAATSHDLDYLGQLARELGALEEPRAETALLLLLERSRVAPASTRPVLRGHVIWALGRVGAGRSIPVLRALQTERDLPLGMRRDCGAAIRQIQQRLKDIPPGGLAVVAEQTAGSLTLADPGGDLALAKSRSKQ